MSVPFPSRVAQVGYYNNASGGQSATIFSGTGVVLGVGVVPLSGTGAIASFSGLPSILVQDGVSGQFTFNSGNAVVYKFDFGSQSGFGIYSVQAQLNPPYYLEFFINSGLTVNSASGWAVTVIYNK